MEDKQSLNEKELKRVIGGTNEDLQKQIEDALNEVNVSNPKTNEIKNKWNL